MKTLSWSIIILFILTSTSKAQQVTSVDCCVDVGSKAMIIINDNQTNAITTPSAKPVADKNGKCDFKLTVSANTSAGVYNAADNLIRTLWNGVRYDAGCYSLQWDGLLDDGTQAPVGSYNIKILTNNVKYEWDTFGNTTKGFPILKNYGGITSIASTGSKVFFGHGFYEGEPTSRAFSTSNIQEVSYVDIGVGVINTGVATDGVNTYWLGVDQYQDGGTNGNSTNYFYVTKVSDNSEVVLSKATQHPSGRPGTQKMVLGWYAAVSGGYSYNGIAATKGTGGFIFLSRGDQNAVYVFNKQTGAVIKTVTVNSAGLLATAGTKLWIKQNTDLKEYDVNSSTGDLTATSISIPNVNTRSFAINNDGSLLKYADEDTRTIKTYNGQTGAYISSFGRVNGYNGNPNVTNNAFSFYLEFTNPCLTFSDDGSYWFNDPGNYRLMHYNASNSYLEQVDYIPSFRSINADPNNPTRVFIDELEYQIDYSKPLDNGTNGSWKLVKNWKENTSLDKFKKFLQIITFPNGKTYATGSLNRRLYWLSAIGSIDVGEMPYDCTLEADGSIYQRVNNGNNFIVVQKALLTGYSGNMPTWGSFTTVVTTPSLTTASPFNFGINTKGASTNTGKYFFFNSDTQTSVPYILGGANTGIGYHLGAIKTGGNTWIWQASKSTFFDYHGDYPRNGDFDLGNNDFLTQHSENCQLLVQGSDLFWNVNGEFWKSSGVNIWNHFNEDGLLVGNFGVTGPEAGGNGQKQMAGNSFSTAIVKVGADYYIYHCDENRWGSGHRWKVSGLNTIKEVSIPITVSAPINKLTDPADLMVGLPYRSDAFTGGNGWVIDQKTASTTVKTNRFQYLKSSVDIDITSGNDAGNVKVKRSLSNTASLNSYTLSGQYTAPRSNTIGDDNYNYLELLDVNGKILARFQDRADTRNNYYHVISLNDKIITQGVDDIYVYYFDASRNFIFNYNNKVLNFKFADFNAVSITTPLEAGGNLAAPAYLRINQGTTGGQNHTINLAKMKFY